MVNIEDIRDFKDCQHEYDQESAFDDWVGDYMYEIRKYIADIYGVYFSLSEVQDALRDANGNVQLAISEMAGQIHSKYNPPTVEALSAWERNQ